MFRIYSGQDGLNQTIQNQPKTQWYFGLSIIIITVIINNITSQ